MRAYRHRVHESQALLCSAWHPKDGKATVSFPIPREKYDHTLELLSGMGFGSIDDPDCLVTALDSPYAALKGLIGTDANADELDCLAKRLEGFHEDEGAQLQRMAHKPDLKNIRDFINLAFCCQKGGQASPNGGVKLEELHDGWYFPSFLYGLPVAAIEVFSRDDELRDEPPFGLSEWPPLERKTQKGAAVIG